MNQERTIEADRLDIQKIPWKDLFLYSREASYSCALYRLPLETRKHFIIECNISESIDKTDLEELGEGFVFHPFNTGNHSIRFIKKDIYLTKDKKKELKTILINTKGENIRKLLDSKPELQQPGNDPEHADFSENGGRPEFIDLVNKAKSEIHNGKFQKVVPARDQYIPLPDSFDAFLMFDALCHAYPNSFIYLVSIPNLGTWIGASPETLISFDKDKIFKTVSLAGTLAIEPGQDPEEISWKQKEIEEQALVSRYIINCFKKIRLREFEEIGPRTFRAGDMVHLRTDFIVDTKQVSFPQLGTVMLELLHPTSAVCGMPKEPALNFIMENELSDREYYSGYLGPVNIDHETNLFVNLRCMKIQGGSVRLFAGAGVIRNSVAEKEWTETEIKIGTVYDVLKEVFPE